MAADPRLRGLPEAVEVTLFRIIDQTIRADPIVRSQVKIIKSWEGSASDKIPPSIGQSPYVRLTPMGSPEQWWSSDSQIGSLTIFVEMMVEGSCSDDIANLWFAIKRSQYPSDLPSRNAYISRLQAAGAHKGILSFTAPAFDVDGGEDNKFHATAQMKIDYRVNYWS